MANYGMVDWYGESNFDESMIQNTREKSKNNMFDKMMDEAIDKAGGDKKEALEELRDNNSFRGGHMGDIGPISDDMFNDKLIDIKNKKGIEKEYDYDKYDSQNTFESVTTRLANLKERRASEREGVSGWDWDSAPLTVKKSIINNDGDPTNIFMEIYGFQNIETGEFMEDEAGEVWSKLYNQAAEQVDEDLDELNWSEYEKKRR